MTHASLKYQNQEAVNPAWEVYHYVEYAATQWPEKMAIYDAFGGLTFRQLHEQVRTLRQALLDHGVQSGMRVGLQLDNSREFIIGLFAGVGCGATIMPLPHTLRRAELDTIIQEVSLQALVYRPEERLAPSDVEISCQTAKLALHFTAQEFSKITNQVTQPAFIRYTSGTTGKSKGVVLSHRTVSERVTATAQALQLTSNDIVTWVLPMAFHFVVSIVAYVRHGIGIAICNELTAQAIIKITNQCQSTILYAAPVHYQMLAGDSSDSSMPSLRLAIATSSATASEVLTKFYQRFSIAVSQVYGIIEVGLPLGNLNKMRELPDSIGQALLGYEAIILDDDYAELGIDRIGHLAVRGPGMFDTYLPPGPSREQVLKKGWFLTGDLAVRNASGFFTIKGRYKSMINVAGNKVFPEEVEAVLEAFPGIHAARVFGKKHPALGEIVCADIVLKRNNAFNEDELRRFCYQRISPYKTPKEISVVEALPMTQSGKVLRHGL